jgi:hypothetical protein
MVRNNKLRCLVVTLTCFTHFVGFILLPSHDSIILTQFVCWCCLHVTLFGSGLCLCVISCVSGHRLHAILFDGVIFAWFYLLALPWCDFVLERLLRAILFAGIIFAWFCLLASPLGEFVLEGRLHVFVIKSHILAAKMKCVTLAVYHQVSKAKFSELPDLPDFWFDGF